MRHVRVVGTTLFTCLLSATIACVSNPRLSNLDDRSPFGDVVITGDQIDAQHVPNAWEALRQLVPRYNYREDRAGRAISISAHRGRSSIALDNSEAPLVIVDGARLSSVDLLQDMPCESIDRIELRNGGRGTNSEGTNASAGVIYIHTRFGSE
ncbi:MAG: TonB-dependent receptor [Gemmatimonadaceae bacterium]